MLMSELRAVSEERKIIWSFKKQTISYPSEKLREDFVHEPLLLALHSRMRHCCTSRSCASSAEAINASVCLANCVIKSENYPRRYWLAHFIISLLTL